MIHINPKKASPNKLEKDPRMSNHFNNLSILLSIKGDCNHQIIVDIINKSMPGYYWLFLIPSIFIVYLFFFIIAIFIFGDIIISLYKILKKRK